MRSFEHVAAASAEDLNEIAPADLLAQARTMHRTMQDAVNAIVAAKDADAKLRQPPRKPLELADLERSPSLE